MHGGTRINTTEATSVVVLIPATTVNKSLCEPLDYFDLGFLPCATSFTPDHQWGPCLDMFVVLIRRFLLRTETFDLLILQLLQAFDGVVTISIKATNDTALGNRPRCRVSQMILGFCKVAGVLYQFGPMNVSQFGISAHASPKYASEASFHLSCRFFPPRPITGKRGRCETSNPKGPILAF